MGLMELRHLLSRLPPPLGASPLVPVRRSYVNGTQTTVLLEPDTDTRRIPERFIHDIWAYRLYDPRRLRTMDGEEVTVLDPGSANRDQGPDFLRARLRIGDLDWLGDVEIHFASSDWHAHAHQADPRYNSVILHVTFVADFWTGRLQRNDGTTMKEVALRPALAMPLRRILSLLSRADEETLACGRRWPEISEELFRGWLRRLAKEKLAERCSLMSSLLPLAGSPEELLYRELMRGLGYSKNSDAFYDLACRVPLRMLRTAGSRTAVEALLFGVAGLLDHPRDKGLAANATPGESADYCHQLSSAFDRLNSGLVLSPMSRLNWTFFRLRPSNFPTLRLAQAGGWFDPGRILNDRTVERLLEAVGAPHPLRELRACLQSTPSEYWRTHLRFGKQSTEQERPLGRERIDNLVRSTILPFLLMIARQSSNAGLARSVYQIAGDLPPQQTEVTKIFAGLGVPPQTSIECEGMHQLYQTRCSRSGCLGCPVGRQLLRREIQTSVPANAV